MPWSEGGIPQTLWPDATPGRAQTLSPFDAVPPAAQPLDPFEAEAAPAAPTAHPAMDVPPAEAPYDPFAESGNGRHARVEPVFARAGDYAPTPAHDALRNDPFAPTERPAADQDASSQAANGPSANESAQDNEKAAALADELEALRAELTAAETEISGLRSERDALQAAIRQVAEERDEARTGNDEMRARLDRQDRERVVLTEQLAAAQGQLGDGLRHLDEAALELQSQMRTTVVRLSTLVAQRLIGRELEADPGLAVTLTRAALSQLRGIPSVEVSAHPTDYPVLKEALEGDRRDPREPLVRVVSDPEVTRGGCMVSAAGAEVDGRLETRLQRLEASLSEAMRAQVAQPAPTVGEEQQ